MVALAVVAVEAGPEGAQQGWIVRSGGAMPAGMAPVVAATLAPTEYHVRPTPEGWQAANPSQGLTVDFSSGGVHVAPTAGGPRLGLSVSRLGRSGHLKAPGPARLEGDGARVDYRRGDVTEWYVNDPRGVEQGFTLDQRPGGTATKPLVVELAPSGGYRPSLDRDGGSITFRAGTTTIHYGALHAYDASGRALPSRLGLAHGRITLSVDDAGAAYPLTIDPLIVTEEAHLFASDDEAGDLFGFSVAVSGDTAVVGAPSDNTTTGGTDAGSAYVFVRTGTTWSEQAHLFASDGEPGDLFGWSVAVSGDTAVVGAPFDDSTGGSDAGSAYVFVRTGTTWSEQAHLFASDGDDTDQFGTSVAVSGDTAVVGAPSDGTTTGGSEAGSAYVFVRSDTTWSEHAHLFASDDEVNDSFGSSVAVSADTAVVGAFFDDTTTGGTNAGSAYVFLRGGTTWSEQAQLFASDGEVNDNFGSSVAVSGDTAVVGAPFDNTTTGGTDAGSTYVFVRTGTAWSEQAHLFASDDEPGDRFGDSVAVSGDTAVVGAPFDDTTTGGTNAGSAYVFLRTGTAWSEQAHLSASDDEPGDFFARSTAVSGDTAVVGAQSDDTTTGGSEAGSAYVYRLSSTVDCAALPAATIMGTPGNDIISGTSGNDVIDGMGGRDQIFGADGDDVIIGGDGDDALIGGNGADTLCGGNGNDSLRGSDGGDRLFGQAGADTLRGETGTPDLCDGGPNFDSTPAGHGCETLAGIP